MSMNQDVYCKNCKGNDVQTSGDIAWSQVSGKFEITDNTDVWYCNGCKSYEHGVIWLYDWEWENWNKEAANGC